MSNALGHRPYCDLTPHRLSIDNDRTIIHEVQIRCGFQYPTRDDDYYINFAGLYGGQHAYYYDHHAKPVSWTIESIRYRARWVDGSIQLELPSYRNMDLKEQLRDVEEWNLLHEVGIPGMDPFVLFELKGLRMRWSQPPLGRYLLEEELSFYTTLRVKE